MINKTQKAGFGVAAALAAGLVTNQAAVAEKPQAPLKQLTGRETPVRADDEGCDAECLEAIIQVVRFAYHVVTQQYEQDKARCKDVYAYQEQEEKECVTKAFNKGVRHFIIIGGGGASLIYLGHNMHRVARMKDDFMGLFKRNPKETELSVDTPKYPELPVRDVAAKRAEHHDDTIDRIKTRQRNHPQPKL